MKMTEGNEYTFISSGRTEVIELSDQPDPPIGHTLRINGYVLRFDGKIYQDVTDEESKDDR